MPNTHVPAAGEAMPAARENMTNTHIMSIDRRRALFEAMDEWNADWRAHIEESPIMAAFRQWHALYEKTCQSAFDEDEDPLCKAMGEIERGIKAVPANTAAELLANDEFLLRRLCVGR